MTSLTISNKHKHENDVLIVGGVFVSIAGKVTKKWVSVPLAMSDRNNTAIRNAAIAYAMDKLIDECAIIQAAETTNYQIIPTGIHDAMQVQADAWIASL